MSTGLLMSLATLLGSKETRVPIFPNWVTTTRMWLLKAVQTTWVGTPHTTSVFCLDTTSGLSSMVPFCSGGFSFKRKEKRKKRDGAIISYNLELHSRNVKQPIPCCKWWHMSVVPAQGSLRLEKPQFETNLSYTGETLLSISRTNSKASVRMLMQAFVSVFVPPRCLRIPPFPRPAVSHF